MYLKQTLQGQFCTIESRTPNVSTIEWQVRIFFLKSLLYIPIYRKGCQGLDFILHLEQYLQNVFKTVHPKLKVLFVN